MDLKEKPAFREKLGIQDEWVMPYEVIPIINIPEFGDTSAVKVGRCNLMHRTLPCNAATARDHGGDRWSSDGGLAIVMNMYYNCIH